MTLTAVNEQIRAAVVDGNRPPLDAIKGHAGLVSFAKRWIPQCWHKSPDKRPTFNSKHDNVQGYQYVYLIQNGNIVTHLIYFSLLSLDLVSLLTLLLGLYILRADFRPNFLLASEQLCLHFVTLYCHCFEYNAVAM